MGKLVKPTIDKSKIMKEAWMIYHYENKSWCRIGFVWCLRKAWAHAKGELPVYHEERIYKAHMAAGDYAYRDKYEAMCQAHMAKIKVVKTYSSKTFSASYHKGAADYYRNAPRGTYFGD